MRAILERCLAPVLLSALLSLSGCGGDDEWNLRVVFNASPAVLPSGGWVTLVWSSHNASSCTADDGWSGQKAGSGSERIWLDGSSSRRFRLSCTDGDRIVASTVEVMVSP